MNPDGSDRRQLSEYEGDIEGFAFSPDEKKVLFISQVKTVKSTADKYPDLDKATGIIVTDLMYKHWDEWVTTAPHPFVADFDGKAISNPVDIMEGEPFESPMKPFGGIEQLAWNTTSDKIAYTSRKKTGKEYALSTNSDIYVYDLNTKKTANISEGIMGYDTNPQYSPDGKFIAWQSMERDGYESDQNRLMVMNLETGEKIFASKDFDSNVDGFVWSADAKALYFTGVWHGESQVYKIDLTDSNKITPLTSGMYDYAGVALLGEHKLIVQRHSLSMGDEIYSIDLADNNKIAQLTTENKHIYDQLTIGKVEGRWMKTTDGKQMLTWVIYPPHFDPNKKYPTLLFCEGGPQSPVSQFWSYRWNMQIMAANDYIVVAPNRRGLPGFGMEWNEQVSGDYGGQCMKDYFTAIERWRKSRLSIRIVWVVWERASEASPFIGWLVTTTNVSKPLLHMTVFSIWKCSIWKQKKCGLLIGIWVVLTGKNRMRRHNVHLPIPRTCLSINGIHRFSASTVKRIIEFWLTRVWRRLMQPSFEVFRPSC